MEWDALTEVICQATRKAFVDLRNSHAGEDFYAYALYTDSGAMTVSPAANSVQSLEKIIENEDDESQEDLHYYKWATSEWAYEAWKSVEFKEISSVLRRSPERKNFEVFKRHLLRSMIEALKQLRDDGFFGSAEERENVVLFVTVTDDDGAEIIENDSAKILNSHSVYEGFVSRYHVSK